MPAAVAVAHVDLHERPGQLLIFPGRRGFAGAQPYDHVADADRMARRQRDFTGFAAPLVEQAQYRDPLRHRRFVARQRLFGRARNSRSLGCCRIR